MGDAGLQMAFFCAPMLTYIKYAIARREAPSALIKDGRGNRALGLRCSKNTIFAAA